MEKQFHPFLEFLKQAGLATANYTFYRPGPGLFLASWLPGFLASWLPGFLGQKIRYTGPGTA